MKRIILAIALCFFGYPALAACPSTLLLKDANNVTAQAKYTDDGSGNCQVNVAVAPNTVNGWTPSTKTSLAATAVSIKASQGQLGFAQCDNPNVSTVYIQLFDLGTGSITLGSTTPTQVMAIPAGLSNGFVLDVAGMQYLNAISVAATATVTGSGAPSIAINCSFGYH